MIELPSSERLKFRHLQPEDAHLLTEFFASGEALKFLSISANDPEAPANWIKRQQTRYENYNGLGLWALIHKDSGEFIGQCGLLVQDVNGKQELEIGYHLLPRQWKKGYATEAAIACKNFAFERNMAESLVSLIDPLNYNSQRVALRNGMKPDGETIVKELSTCIYRIHRAEWK